MPVHNVGWHPLHDHRHVSGLLPDPGEGTVVAEAGAGSHSGKRLSPQTPRVNTDGVGDDRSGRRGRERAVSRTAQWRCVSRKLF